MAAVIFRRTVASRLAPVLVAAGLLALLVGDAVAGTLTLSWWPLLMVVLAALAALAAVMAVGDEIHVEEDGIRTRNRYLRRERFLAWEEIREVRAYHGRSGQRLKVAFVVPQQGPRLVLDSLGSLDRLVDLIQARRDSARAPDL